MWMHNGHIASFSKIKRKIVENIRDEYFLKIEGSTDSEYVSLPPVVRIGNLDQELTAHFL